MSAVPGFLPSTNAPLFPNGPWPPGTSFNVSIAGLPVVSINTTQMGFCGGMSFLTRDIFESGTPQLRGRLSQDIPLPLAQFIEARLITSFDGPGTVAEWLAFTQKPDHDTLLGGPGTFHMTVDQCPAIMADIDAGHLCPIGVVLIESLAPWDVFQNHVELVWAYDLAGSQLTLHVYDCNRPGQDDITISLDISSETPAKTISTNGTSNLSLPGTVRGFFHLPYTHADPSPAYIDGAAVAIPVPPPAQMMPGTVAAVEVSAFNTGSTSWTPTLNYRLGSQAPQDNTIWGHNRIDLPGPDIDPQQTAFFSFQITAPNANGWEQFCWQMVRDGVHWFGAASPDIRVAVGTPTPVATLSATTINFGTHDIGSVYPPKIVTLTNTGTGPLVITNVSLTGDTTDFYLDQPSTCQGATLGPGQACTVSVIFDPTRAVACRATLVFTDNAGGSPQQVLLEGTGKPSQL